MTDLEQRLLSALSALEAAVATLAVANPKPNLLEHFAAIDTLTASLPSSTDPGLLHYLRKRSYQKARLYLQGQDAENAAGNCGHR